MDGLKAEKKNLKIVFTDDRVRRINFILEFLNVTHNNIFSFQIIFINLSSMSFTDQFQ